MAGPARKRAPTRTLETDEISRLNSLQSVICTSLEDDKAEDIVVLDLVGRAAFVDRMVIATGLVDRQIMAMAGHLEQKLREAGVKGIRVEGGQGSDWVLVDAGDFLVHLFKPDSRDVYGLEKMWSPELDEPKG